MSICDFNKGQEKGDGKTVSCPIELFGQTNQKSIEVEFGHTLNGSKIPQQTKITDRSACHQEQPQRSEIMSQDLSTKLAV
jgi:hypothetical protein